MAKHSKDLAQLIRFAQSRGWKVEKTKNNHYKWTPPSNSEGRLVFSGSTLSDHRALSNIFAMLRQIKGHNLD